MSTLSDESYVFQSEFYTSRIKAAEQAAAEAARTEALADGELHGEAKALVRILGARGFTVTTTLSEQIMTCDDPARLDQALDLALTADPGQDFAF